MAAISSFNGLFVRVVFLFALAYFCFVDINKILENSYVLVLTQAMNLPGLMMSKNSAQLGVFGILFLLSAVQDLIPLLETNKKHFNSIVPVRLLIFFILTGMSYMWESNFYVHNNAVFIYSFIEVWINFVVFGALREERNNEFTRVREGYTEEENYEVEDDNFGESEPTLSSAQEIEQISEINTVDE